MTALLSICCKKRANLLCVRCHSRSMASKPSSLRLSGAVGALDGASSEKPHQGPFANPLRGTRLRGQSRGCTQHPGATGELAPTRSPCPAGQVPSILERLGDSVGLPQMQKTGARLKESRPLSADLLEGQIRNGWDNRG
jgi:hypothetical protein